MKIPNRDLLVMYNEDLMTPQSLENEVSFLHQLLQKVERIDNVIKAHELINLQQYKITRKALKLKAAIRSTEHKPFIFINNLN